MIASGNNELASVLSPEAIEYSGDFPIPEEERTEAQRYALSVLADGGQDAYWALEYLSTESFLRRPEDPNATVAFVDNNLDFFRPTPGRPTKEHARDRALLGGIMGVTYTMIALEAFTAFVRNGTTHVFRMSECPEEYVVASEGSNEPSVEAYPPDSPEDGFMRSIALLTDAGERVAEQMEVKDSPYARFKPVWDLEIAIRLGLRDIPHTRNTQHQHDNPGLHPLSRERIVQSSAQFLRNTMHYLLLVANSLPPETPVADIQTAAVDRVAALIRASQYIRDLQRAFMGIPGEDHDKMRKRFSMEPHMVETDDGHMIAGLTERPTNRSACSGQDPHDVLVQNHLTPEVISPIGAFVLFGGVVAPFTLFRDRVPEAAERQALINNMAGIARKHRRLGVDTPTLPKIEPNKEWTLYGTLGEVAKYIQGTRDNKLQEITETCSPEVSEIARRLINRDILHEDDLADVVLDRDIVPELHRLMQEPVLSGRIGLQVSRGIYNHRSLRLSALIGDDEIVDYGDGELDIAYCGSAKRTYLPDSTPLDRATLAWPTLHDPHLYIGYYRDPDDAIVQALLIDSPLSSKFKPPQRFGDFFVATSHQIAALYEARDQLEGFVHSRELGTNEIRSFRYPLQLLNSKTSLGFSYASRECTSRPWRVRFEDLPPNLLVLSMRGSSQEETENLLDELRTEMGEHRGPRALDEALRNRVFSNASLRPLSGTWGSMPNYDAWTVQSRHGIPIVRDIDTYANQEWLFNAWCNVIRGWERRSTTPRAEQEIY